MTSRHISIAQDVGTSGTESSCPKWEESKFCFVVLTHVKEDLVKFWVELDIESVLLSFKLIILKKLHKHIILKPYWEGYQCGNKQVPYTAQEICSIFSLTDLERLYLVFFQVVVVTTSMLPKAPEGESWPIRFIICFIPFFCCCSC